MSGTDGSTVDVVVVGAGAAGVMAALAAREAGAEVAILAGPPGATSLSSGAVDLAAGLAAERTVGDALASLCDRLPAHPLGHLGGERCKELALRGEQLLCDEEGLYALRGLEAGHLLAVTALGAARPTWLLQRTQADLSAAGPGPVAVLAPTAVGSAATEAFAATLASTAREGGGELETRLWPLPEVEGLDFGRPLHCAHLLDTDGDVLDRLADALEASRPEIEPALLLIPPIAGIDRWAGVIELLRRAAGVPVAELLGTAGGAPGLRLERHLEGLADDAGIRVLRGRAGAATRFSDRIESLSLEPREPDCPKALRARSFVLATGGLAGGGLVLARTLAEPLLELPLELDGAPLAQPQTLVGHDPTTLFGSDPCGSHPALRAGVAPTADLRAPGLENAWVAGALLSGSDPAHDGSGLGTAIVTGLHAGDLAARS